MIRVTEPAPRMIIVAGPPGGGKSSHFPVKNSGVEWFNSDDRAAQLNAGSYHNIPVDVRAASGRELQRFIESRIEGRQSFAFENALRTDIVFEQIWRAKGLGFEVLFDYLAAGPVEEHIRRVINRARLGGHSASERKLRSIYENSMRNLLIAFEGNRSRWIDVLRIFDNSENLGQPRLVLSLVGAVPRTMLDDIPPWLNAALQGSDFTIEKLRARR